MNKYIGISRPLGIVRGRTSNLDAKYGPYDTINHALTQLPEAIRKVGLTVGIISIKDEVEIINEYWWKEGTSDDHLVKKVWEFKDLSEEEKDELKLYFEDLSPEEKFELKLKFEDLTPSDKLELKGAKGDTGDHLTVRKTYQTEALALADKNPINTATSLPLIVGQFVSIVDDGEKNGIYRISSIGGDGTMSLELQGKLGDLSEYAKYIPSIYRNTIVEKQTTVKANSFSYKLAPLGDNELSAIFIPPSEWYGYNRNFTSRLLYIGNDTTVTSQKSGLIINSNVNGNISVTQQLNGVKTVILTLPTKFRIYDSLQISIKTINNNTISLQVEDEVFEITTSVADLIRNTPSVFEFNPPSDSGSNYTYNGTMYNLRVGLNLLKQPTVPLATPRMVAEEITTDGAETKIINIAPLGDLSIGAVIKANKDWMGYQSKYRSRVFDIKVGINLSNHDYIRFTSNDSGHIVITPVIGSATQVVTTTSSNILKGFEVIISFTDDTAKVNLDGVIYNIPFESARIAKSRGFEFVFKPIPLSSLEFLEGSLSNLRIGDNLTIETKESRLDTQTLLEKIEVFNDIRPEFYINAPNEPYEIAFTTKIRDGWNGVNGNWTAGIISIGNYKLLICGSGNVLFQYANGSIIETVIPDIVGSRNESLDVILKISEGGFELKINELDSVTAVHSDASSLLGDDNLKVVLNPYSGTRGYFYEATYSNLRAGVYLNNDEITGNGIDVFLERKIIPLNIISSLPYNRMFNAETITNNTESSRLGAISSLMNSGGKKATVKKCVFSIDKAGYSTISLPVKIGGDKTYLLDGKAVEPINGSSIQKLLYGYDGVNEYIHPSIAYSPTAIGGYNYFMFVSNYPLENPRYEDDDILVSNDGLSWERVEAFNKASSGSPKLPMNVFLQENDSGREDSFVPTPSAGSPFKMNGIEDFTPVRTLKHDPEIATENGYVYLYNYYNFYEALSDETASTASGFHRFVVVFRTNNLIDWEICRTDGSVINANESNLKEIFTQSSVDGKNNYIRYFNWEDNPELKTPSPSNMQVVKDDSTGLYYAYYKPYGGMSLTRYTGTSLVNFDWSTYDSCVIVGGVSTQEHPDVFYYGGKYYWINSTTICESPDGITFTPLPEINLQGTLPSGRAYKTDVCIGVDNHLFVANSGLIRTYSKPSKSNGVLTSPQSVKTVVHKISSMDDFIDYAKNGRGVGSMAASVSIYPTSGAAKSFVIPIITSNKNWTYKTLIDYDFKGGEEVLVEVLAYNDSETETVQFGDVIVE